PHDLDEALIQLVDRFGRCDLLHLERIAPQRPASAVDDRANGLQRRAEAAVRDRRVELRDLVRRELDRAEKQRRVERSARLDAKALERAGAALETDLEPEIDRREVQRLGKRANRG